MNRKRTWIPEIVYEDADNQGISDGFPIINIPKEKEMPYMLFVLGATETGEFEPDSLGMPQPITDMEPYQFANMKYLEEALSSEDYDKVRDALGAESKSIAKEKGLNLPNTIEL